MLSGALVAWDQEVVLLLPLPLLLSVNLGRRAENPGLHAFNQGMLLAVPALLAVLGLADAAAAVGHPSLVLAGLGLLATGVVGLAVQAGPVAAVLRRLLPYDPSNQVHVLALVLTVGVVGSQITTQLTTDVLASAAKGASLSRLDLVAQEIPFLLAALVGVGWLTRRSGREAALRLGYVVPAWWQVALAVAAAGAFFAFGTGMDWLAQQLTPDLAHRVGAANSRLFGGLGDPVGILTLAVVPGLCEEALFRGALQPRLGLAWTAIVFAAVHTQYGLSLDALAVLILAFGLGILRHYTNTTTSTVCHVVYNGLVGFGIGWLGGAGPGVAAEGILVAVLLAAGGVFVSRRRDASEGPASLLNRPGVGSGDRAQ